MTSVWNTVTQASVKAARIRKPRSPSDERRAAIGDRREAEEGARRDADQRGLLGQAGEQAEEGSSGCCATEIAITPSRLIRIASAGAEAERVAQDQDAEDRGLHGLGLGVGGADREVAEREGVEQERGRDDLGEAADQRVERRRSDSGAAARRRSARPAPLA